MKAFFIIWIFLAISAFAQSVHYYPYDDTDSVSCQLPCDEKKIELRAAQSRIVTRFLCGAYRGEFDFTSGYTLHVFPDKTFMIEEWGDIGLPKLVAEGLWSVGDKGDVIFDWKKKDFGGEASETFFREQYGEYKKMKLFLCFSDKVVQGVLLVSDEMVRPQIEHAYRRKHEYIDWLKIQNDLKKKKG